MKRMKTMDNRISKSLKSGPSLQEWLFQNVFSNKFRLELLEYGQTVPRTHGVGGDLSMETDLERKVRERFLDDEYVEAIYCYPEDEELQFIILTKEHDLNKNLRIMDVFWELYDETHIKFKFKPIPKDYFNEVILPKNCKVVLGGRS